MNKIPHCLGLFFCFFMLILKAAAHANYLTVTNMPACEAADTIYVALQEVSPDTIGRPSPLLQQWRFKQKKNKKVVAVLLAFPFPFGIVGLHRIYLGCSPYVPVAYIASLGGVFGVLPFIDFCVLLLDKDIDRYLNNKKIFMWVN